MKIKSKRRKQNDYSLQRQIKIELHKNPNSKDGVFTNRILIGIPSTGLVRLEWVTAKYSQIIPTNWSNVEMTQMLSEYAPLDYQLPDAENLMAKVVVEGNYEWFFSLEQDNVLPPDAFIRLNEYMTSNKVPIVSGLYFTKSQPPEPIVYRGRGNGSFQNFKLGDKVWADGIPFGCALIHGSIIRALWDESEEYMVGNEKTRRVFSVPGSYLDNKGFQNKDIEGEGHFATIRGTTDLNFCKRIMKDGIFAKAGWPAYQKKKYPFLVDTKIFVQHIDERGRNYPLGGVPKKYDGGKGYKPKTIK